MANADGGARLTYSTDKWGGTEGVLHFEISVDGRVAQITVDGRGVEVFAPTFLTLGEPLSMNCARLRFVDSLAEVQSPFVEERARIRKELLASFNEWPPRETFEEALDRICPEE